MEKDINTIVDVDRHAAQRLIEPTELKKAIKQEPSSDGKGKTCNEVCFAGTAFRYKSKREREK
jgi:hypothetical protein